MKDFSNNTSFKSIIETHKVLQSVINEVKCVNTEQEQESDVKYNLKDQTISLDNISTTNTSNLKFISQSSIEMRNSQIKDSKIQDISIYNEYEEISQIKSKYESELQKEKDLREIEIHEKYVLKRQKDETETRERQIREEAETLKKQIQEAEIREKKLQEEAEAREIRLREAKTREIQLQKEAEIRERNLKEDAEVFEREFLRRQEETEARERQFREEVEIRERKLKEETKAQIKENLRLKEESEARERQFREELEVRERQIQEKAEARVKEALCAKEDAETRERRLRDEAKTRERPLQEEEEVRLNEALGFKNIYEKEQKSLIKDTNEMEIDDNINFLINNKFDNSHLENFKNVFEFYPKYFTTIFNKKLGSMKKCAKNKKQCSSCFTYLNLDYSKCKHCDDFFHIDCCFIEKSTICNNCYKEFELDIFYEPINLNTWKSTCKNCKKNSTEGFCKECRQIILKQIESFGLIPPKDNLIKLELKACVMTEETRKIFHESIEIIFKKRKIKYLNENVYTSCVKNDNDATKDPTLKKLSPKDVLTIIESKGSPVKLVEDDEQGVVVCATEEIEKNSYLCEYQGEVVPQRSIIFSSANDSFMDLLKTGISAKNLTIDPTNQCNWAKFVSGHPDEKKCNVKSVTVNIDGNAKVILYAIKNIQKDEILYYNYFKPKKLDKTKYLFKKFYSKIKTNETHNSYQKKYNVSNVNKIDNYFISNNIKTNQINIDDIFNSNSNNISSKRNKKCDKSFSMLNKSTMINILRKKRNKTWKKEKTILNKMLFEIKNVEEYNLIRSFKIEGKNMLYENLWIEYLKNRSRKTYLMYIKYVYLFEKWCNDFSLQISSQNIENFILETKAKKFELKDLLCALKSKYEQYYKIELIKIPKIAKVKEKRMLTKETYDEVLQYFDLKNDGTKEYVKFLYHSACRKNESIKIKWTDMTTDKKGYKVFINASKLGNPRQVHISKKLFKEIESKFDNTNEFIFPKKMTSCADSINKFNLHQLRHKRATDLYNLNVPVSDISYILGHKYESTTRKYLNLDCDLKFSNMNNDALFDESEEGDL